MWCHAQAIERLHEGVLLSVKKSVWVSVSGMVDLAAQALTIALLLGSSIQTHPMAMLEP